MFEGKELSTEEFKMMLEDSFPAVSSFEEINVEPLKRCPRCGNQTLLEIEKEEYSMGLGVIAEIEGRCLKCGAIFTPAGRAPM